MPPPKTATRVLTTFSGIAASTGWKAEDANVRKLRMALKLK
jgi:hypothetical protein